MYVWLYYYIIQKNKSLKKYMWYRPYEIDKKYYIDVHIIPMNKRKWNILKFRDRLKGAY